MITKNNSYPINSYLITLIIILFCQAQLAAQDPFEPNDSYDKATPVNCNQAWLPYIQTLGDVDWYEVELTEPGVLEVALTSVPANLDLHVEIHQLVGNVLTKITRDVNGDAHPGDPIFCQAVVPAGTYFILVEDEHDNGFSVDDPYEILVSCTPNNLELNQIYEDAAPIPSDTCFEENIYGFNCLYPEENDTDWFRVNLSGPGALEVTLTSVPAVLDLNVTIYQVINNVLTKITHDVIGNATSGEAIFAYAVVDAGEYLIEVIDENHNGNTEETFLFCVEFHPDNLELNQIYEDAAPIPSDTCFEANIYGFNCLFPEENDIDWFEIQVTTPCTLDIDITSVPAEVDLHLALYQIVNNVLTLVSDDGSSASGGEDRFLDQFIDPGSYLVLVEDENDNDKSEDTYQICVSCDPATGVNHAFSEGVSIFPNPGKGLFYLEGIGSKTTCNVFAANGQLLTSTVCQNGILELETMAAGSYFLQLTDGQNSAWKKIIIEK